MASDDKKKYYWLKLYGDLFTSKRIKKLRKLGADFFIIYLKMQLVSLQDGGMLRFDGVEDNFAEEIALEIDEDPDKVQLTISYLQSCGLMELTDDGEFFLPYVDKCTGSETGAAIRKREYRGQCPTLVPIDGGQSLQEIEIEKEIRDREIEKELDSMPLTMERIVTHWNDMLSPYGLSEVKAIKSGTKRYTNLNARLKQYGEEQILQAIDNITLSSFLRGKTGWVITFDWFVLPNNFVKVLEGNYTDRETDVGTTKAKEGWWAKYAEQ